MHCKPKLDMSQARSMTLYRMQAYNTDKPSLSRDMLRCPGEVTSVETEGTVLGVTTTNAHCVDALCSKLGVGRLTTELEFSLLAVVGALGTSCRTFVPRRTRNTWTSSD
jgi:hypothetical protein